MKKRILIALVGLLVTTISAKADSPLRFGIKGGLNLSDIYISELNSTFSPDNYSGFHVGLMTEFMLPVFGLGVDGTVMYSQKGFKVDNSVFNTSNIDVPINLKWKFGLPIVKVFIATGPYFSFGIGKSELVLNNGSIKANNVNMGWNVGGGVELFKHLQVSAAYGFGFTNANKWNINNIITHGQDRVLTISAAYLF